jgi:hypothetical protein
MGGCASSSAVKETEFSKEASFSLGSGSKSLESNEKKNSNGHTPLGGSQKSLHMKEIRDISVSDMNSESTGRVSVGGVPGRVPLPRSGSVIRNGVYYSESEISEEGCVWQPKYWTPDRIGSWIEDIEYPDGMRFQDVCKVISHSHVELLPRPHMKNGRSNSGSGG